MAVGNAAAPVGSAARLDLLLISDQIGSGKTRMSELAGQVQRHFETLFECISGLPGANAGDIWVIKNIGDSLMIRVSCSSADIPTLLRKLTSASPPVNRRTQPPVNLRILVMMLKRGSHDDFILGETIWPENEDRTKDLDAKYASRVRGAQGSLTKWLEGDLFGPGINLAFRAASIPVDTPSVIVDEEIIKYLDWHRADSGLPFEFHLSDEDNNKIQIGQRLEFTPIRGLEKQYVACEPDNAGWSGHLFLRSVRKFDSNLDNKQSVDALAHEQQRYKCFTRFMWSEEPNPEDLDELAGAILRFQAGASYFRSLSAVIHTREIRRGSPPSTPARPTSNMRPGLLGIFAGPFETTYEIIHKKILDFDHDQSGFSYPLSTLVYNNPDKKKLFWNNGQQSPRWHVVIFWRWLPENRRDGDTQGDDMVRMVVAESVPDKFDRAQVGMLVGGEWDGYAILRPKNSSENLIEDQEELEDMFLRLAETFETSNKAAHAENIAVYFCCNLSDYRSLAEQPEPVIPRSLAS